MFNVNLSFLLFTIHDKEKGALFHEERMGVAALVATAVVLIVGAACGGRVIGAAGRALLEVVEVSTGIKGGTSLVRGYLVES